MPTPLQLLIIDDRPDDVQGMLRAITSDGFTVTADVVTNLRDLRRRLGAQLDLVLCAERLATCTGMEALHVIRSVRQDLPVVMLAPSLSEDTIVALFKAGAQNCLSKERLLLLGPLIRRELQETAQRTRRLEAEQALRRSEERFRLLADNAFDVIWATDLDLRFTFIGAAVRRMLGYAPQEVMGLSLAELIPDDGRQRLTELHGFYLNAARHDPYYPPFFTELEMQHRDGRRVIAEISAFFLRDEKHRPIGLQGIARDITLRRLMERDQAEHRQELAAIIARVPSLLLVMDADRRVQKVAGAMTELMGRPVEDMLGRRCGEALGCAHAHDGMAACDSPPACARCALCTAVRTVMDQGLEQPARDAALTLDRPEGRRDLTVSLSATPLMIGGRRMAMLSIADVSEARANEARLRILSTAVEQSPSLVLILSLDHRITYANARLTDITGLTQEQVLAQPFHQLFSADLPLQLDQDIWTTVATGRFWEGEIPLRRHDGGVCWVRALVNDIRDDDGTITHHVAIASDISELLRAQEEAHQHHQRLMQADKMMALGTLVAGVAHEVNNPASFISLNTPLLEDTWASSRPILDRHAADQGDFLLGGLPYSEMRDQVPRIFAGIRDGLSRIRTIVGDLKDFARHGPTDHGQQVDLNAVVRAASSLLMGNVHKATTRFQVVAAPDLPPVTGHFQRLEQVVINLVQNACEALTDPAQSITITTRHDRDARRVLLEVADQGVGMPESLLPRITEPFFTTRARNGGTGLGLSIVATIVKEHRGELEFTTAPGKGTQVMVSLPEREDDAATGKRP